MKSWKRVLVFGAHSDDEIIGPGGTIAKLAERGSHVTVVTFTTGDTGYSKKAQKGKIASLRNAEAEKAAGILGIKDRINLGIPTQAVVNTRELYQKCAGIIRNCRPDVIFTHYCEDRHRDHRAISQITDEARWKASENTLPDLGRPWYTPELYYYEVLELFTHPSLIVDISTVFKKKIEAIKSQASQMDVLPGIIKYIEGLASSRGYLGEAEHAEAFLSSNMLPKVML